MKLRAETAYETIERQHEVIDQLRADNKALIESAEALLEQMEDLREENAQLKAQLAGRRTDRDGEEVKP